MSELAKQLIEESLRTKDPYLDLGNCGLDGTEPILDRLAECEHLETLIFSNDLPENRFKQILTRRKISQQQPNNFIKFPRNLPPNIIQLLAVGVKPKIKSDDLKYPIEYNYFQKRINIILNSGYERLVHLDISDNALGKVVLNSLTLKYLTINNCNISQLSIQSINSLLNTEILDSYIDEMSLANLNSLIELNLSFTKINSLKFDSITTDRLDITSWSIYLESFFSKRIIEQFKLENHFKETLKTFQVSFLQKMAFMEIGIEDSFILNKLYNNILKKLFLKELTNVDLLKYFPRPSIFTEEREEAISKIIEELENKVFSQVDKIFENVINLFLNLPNDSKYRDQAIKEEIQKLNRKEEKIGNEIEQAFNNYDNNKFSREKRLSFEYFFTFLGVQIEHLILSSLDNLAYLRLSGNVIQKLTIQNNHPNLTVININKNLNINIKQIIEEIAKHTKVIKLNISELNFEYLPFDFFRLNQLMELSLNNTPIKDLPLHSNLSHLKRLNLRGCKALKTIPQDLRNLEELDISNGCVPQGLIGLLQKNPQLKHLDISNNAYPYIPELPNLEYLNLSKARVQTVSFLKNAVKLRELHLGSNQIKDLTPLLNLENLEILDVSNNKIKSFPISLVKNSPNLQELYLEGNQIENLPERKASSKQRNAIESIRNYIQALEEDEVIPNDQIKILLLGNSTTGKSSLIEYLTNQAFTEVKPSTHGIEHIIWKPFAQLEDASKEEKNIKVAIWDFGGQEFYHATHSLFFSNKALYLILFDQETNFQGIKDTWIYLYENALKVQKEVPLEHFHYHYWLDNIRHYNDQPDTLLIQNKCDISDAIEIPTATKKIYSLKSNKHIFYISVKDAFHKQDKGDFQVFQNKLFDHIRDNVGKFKNSKRWQEIKNKLQSEWAPENVLSFDQYVIRCQGIKPNIHDKENKNEQSQLDTLTEMLHEQGVLLHFPNIPELKNDVYVNPAWLTDCIYKVLDYNVIKNKGRFDFSHITKIAKNIEGISTNKLLALLKHFKLIFEIQRFGKESFITPQYLPEEFDEETQLAVDTFKATNKPKLCFILSYPDFLPVSVFLKFLAIYGNLHEQHWYTKNELVFIKNNQVVVAKCTRDQYIRQISIEISGKHSKLTQEMFDTLYTIDPSDNLQVSIDGKEFHSNEEIRNPKYRSIYQKDFWFILGESPESDSKFKDILGALQKGLLDQALEQAIPHVLGNGDLTAKLFQNSRRTRI